MKPSELIEERGWIQDEFQTKDGYCMLGALRECVTDWGEYKDVWCKLCHHLRKQLNRSGGSLFGWNDHPKRTKRQVITALKAIGQ